ncbi:hypothetical protein [Geobacter sp. DSM 9736]|uniref:hypothetical protein n=1 Tax=Geobacter sp. DSM 9736 TaxID=1277350 RepID=UPI000B500D6C|nr:hypothetical protein [Geobacter sp. DSM 9736]SNB45494.1 hypothetical protein SAMN06269301_0911 [Geobacter sp. DSM 9736]
MRQQTEQLRDQRAPVASTVKATDDTGELIATIAAAVALVIIIAFGLVMAEILTAPKFVAPVMSEEAWNGVISDN